MSVFLLVSTNKLVLRPMARALLRATALLATLPVEFRSDHTEYIAISSGSRYLGSMQLLESLAKDIDPELPIPESVEQELVALKKWLCAHVETGLRFPELSFTSILENVRQCNLFYNNEKQDNKYAAFWEAWNAYYPAPQHFNVIGVSKINSVNQSEASDYLRAHKKAGTGVPSIDNATQSFLAVLPPDAERILDVGSGPGYMDRHIPPDYTVLAMDIDPTILCSNIRQTCVGDIMDIPLEDGAVDLAMACDVLEHLPDDVLDKGLSELTRVSRKYLYLQVPLLEDQLMAMAYCPNCHNMWHVNHHKRRFSLQQLAELMPKGWTPVCVNYTGDVSFYRPGTLEWDLAQNLNWKIACVEKSVCPICGNESAILGENDLKLLRRIGFFNTGSPFPVYTEIGILFCRDGVDPQIPPVQHPLCSPDRRRLDKLMPGEVKESRSVYTGTELLPCIYSSGCYMENVSGGYRFLRENEEDVPWIAVSFPPLQNQHSGIRIWGSISKGEQTVSVALLDSNGQEHYFQDWSWDTELRSYQLSYSTQYVPTYIKLYFHTSELLLHSCELIGGKPSFYLFYPNVQDHFLISKFKNIQYRFFTPNHEGLPFSHPIEEWLRITSSFSDERRKTVHRFSRMMNGEPVLPNGDEDDRRFLITQSAASIDAFLKPAQELGLLSAQKPELILDSKDMLTASLFAESILTLSTDKLSANISQERWSDSRSIVMVSLLAEASLSVYTLTNSSTWLQRIKRRSLAWAKHEKNRLHDWLHRHEKVYEILISIGVKDLYLRLKRRIKL